MTGRRLWNNLGFLSGPFKAVNEESQEKFGTNLDRGTSPERSLSTGGPRRKERGIGTQNALITLVEDDMPQYGTKMVLERVTETKAPEADVIDLGVEQFSRQLNDEPGWSNLDTMPFIKGMLRYYRNEVRSMSSTVRKRFCRTS